MITINYFKQLESKIKKEYEYELIWNFDYLTLYISICYLILENI